MQPAITPYVQFGRDAESEPTARAFICKASHVSIFALCLLLGAIVVVRVEPVSSVSFLSAAPVSDMVQGTHLFSFGGAIGGAIGGAQHAYKNTEKKAKSALQSVANSSSAREFGQDVKRTAGKVQAAAKKAEKAVAPAAQQMKDKIEDLGGGLANYTYSIPPPCLDAMEVAAVVAAGGVASPLLLGALGFTEEGVEAASLASLWQGTIGDVEKDSVFAKLQSIGARGVLATTSMQVAGAMAVAASTFCATVDTLCKGCGAKAKANATVT